MTRNLIAEMVKAGIPANQAAKEVAKAINVSEKTARNKINCVTGFTVPEAVKRTSKSSPEKSLSTDARTLSRFPLSTVAGAYLADGLYHPSSKYSSAWFSISLRGFVVAALSRYILNYYPLHYHHRSKIILIVYHVFAVSKTIK